MRILPLCLVFLASSAISAGAQDTIVTWNLVSPPTIVELAASGTHLGPVLAVVPLPPHLRPDRADFVTTGGGRFVAWVADTGGYFGDCREYVAVYDRRARSVGVLPGYVVACGTTRLVADTRRTRIFVHKFGFAASIGVVDETLTYRLITAGSWIGTEIAYAPDADRLFVTRRGAFAGDFTHIVVLDGSTGVEITSFPVPTTATDNLMHIEVTSDGSRVFFYHDPLDGPQGATANVIRLFDVPTGQQLAVSRLVNLGYYSSNKFIIDEKRNIIVVPHRVEGPPVRHELLAFDASTLELLGEGNPGAYGALDTVQPLVGHGNTATYVATAAMTARDPNVCGSWIDALDGHGLLRSRVNVLAVAGLGPTQSVLCNSMATVLSPPERITGLRADVVGRQVVLTWTNPPNTSAVELEVGFAPGHRDFAFPLGTMTTATFNDVPPGVYYVRVHAVNEIGAGPRSGEIVVPVP